ncbi:hypothetical protein A5699_07200 [Mycobacterium sp. E802]|uniref:hypothetical protein n=1 Tax=Mycobacterium sp. E802 TaxID=1834152 RepID=UPI0007FDC522|nr:hypothetical protein [Mycobacterium sp. E802]OBG82076.1 hypothetical protein A5699_07200 [Mycobacterium sp. E802]
MSVFHPVSVLRREAAPQTTPAVHTHEPVLITEQQVLFSTAAAVGAPPRHTLMATMSEAMSHAVSSAVTHWRTREVRPYYPPRMSYLEHSLMAREMDRL